MKIKIRKNNVFLKNIIFAVFFIYIIDPFFLSFAVTINRVLYYLIVIIPIIWFIIKNGSKFHIDKDMCLFLELSLAYIVITFIQSGVIGRNLVYVSYLIKLIFKIFALLSLYLIWKRVYVKRKISWSFEETFVNAVIIYVISTLIFLLIPAAKDFWINLIYNDKQPLWIIRESGYATRYGLAGWSSFGEAYMMLIGSIYLLNLYLKKNINKLGFIIKFVFILLGSFFYGRFATVLLIIIFIGFTLYTLVVQKKWWVVSLMLMIIVFAISTLIYLYNNESTQAIVLWALEPIMNMFSNGAATSSSTDELYDMYKNFSPSIQEILVGSGKWTGENSEYYGATDVGFMRSIYFSGVFVTMLMYTIDFFLIHYFAKTYRKKDTNKNAIAFLVIVLSLVVIVADLKGDMAITFIRYVLPLVFVNKFMYREVKGDNK